MSSTHMYEHSGSQFFRTTTGIQSGPDASVESRFVMTFLTSLGATEKLCRFRLVLEWKTGKEIPESSRLKLINRLDMHKHCYACNGVQCVYSFS